MQERINWQPWKGCGGKNFRGFESHRFLQCQESYMIDIKLSTVEMISSALLGALTRIESLVNGRQNSHDYNDEDSWTVDIEGAGAEMAVAKYRNVFWMGSIGKFKKENDVFGVEVRSTTLERGSLIIREGDQDDAKFILVVGKLPHKKIIGWIYGKEAKQSKWLRSPNGREPAYFVPQDVLKDLNTLGK